MDYIVSRGQVSIAFSNTAHIFTLFARKVRISLATSKFKQPASLAVPAFELPQVSFAPPANLDASNQSVTIALPLPNLSPAKSVSFPIAATGSNTSFTNNATSMSTSGSFNSLSATTDSSASISTSAYGNPEDALAFSLAQKYIGLDTSPTTIASLTNPYLHQAQIRQQQMEEPISEEYWKHHTQARATLENLIGPYNDRLSSTDTYNTTVFVGGLSPLISEETLRTFFAPFSNIHYVRGGSAPHHFFTYR